MRAIWVERFAEPPDLQLKTVPMPALRAGEVRIAVHAAGLNFADTLMAAGRYQVKPPLPFAPGMEAAGVVDALGEGVQGLQVGQRVMTMCGWGAFAEAVCVSAGMVFPIPDAVGMEPAATFPITYGTTYHALTDRAALQPGEWLVVHGAGSGVGLNAVELGRLMGARVIAVCSSARKLEAVLRYRPEVLIDHAKEDVRERVLELTGGRGADVIFDPVGGDVFQQSLRCIAPSGRLLVLGFASGTIPHAAANRILLKGCAVVGVNTARLIGDDLPLYRRRFEMMLRWVADGRLAPLVGARYALDELPRAMHELINRQIAGKAVVLPST